MRAGAVVTSGCMTPHAAWVLIVLLVVQLPNTLQAFQTCGDPHHDSAAADKHDASRLRDEYAHQPICGDTPAALQRTSDSTPTARPGSDQVTSDSGIACRGRAGKDSPPSSSCCSAIGGCASPGPLMPETLQASQLDVDHDHPRYLSDNFCSLLSPLQKVRVFLPSTLSLYRPLHAHIRTRCAC